MGFPKDAFCGAITSGEVTHSMFERRPTPFWAARRRCLHLTWSARGAISLEGLGLEVTTDPELADCIVAHGTEALGTSPTGAAPQPSSPQQLRALLDACAALPRPPPMIVANPDLVTVQGAELRVMPGTLAAWYKAAGGGEIHLMGKPAGVIYDRALRLLGLPAAAVLAVGDSLEHDVAGARGAGVDAVFVAGGIHAKELGVGPPGGGAQGAGVAEGPLRELCRRHGAAPAYVIPYFAL
jgi:ribonucleotide monophosphatase NagD (HAD superfamily)